VIEFILIFFSSPAPAGFRGSAAGGVLKHVPKIGAIANGPRRG
jgi:hypothetical protein